MNANPAPKPVPNVNPTVNPGETQSAAPFVEALAMAAKGAKAAIDERNLVRGFLLEFFKARRTPLTFIHTIEGLRSDGYKTSITAPSAGEKRSVVLSHLSCGGSFNDLPENLYKFALETGLVEFAAKIRRT